MSEIWYSLSTLKAAFIWYPWGLNRSIFEKKNWDRPNFAQISYHTTPGETEYEWKKTEQVPIQLPNIARTLFDAKKIIKKNFLAWTSEIIQFIRFENHMDGPG